MTDRQTDGHIATECTALCIYALRGKISLLVHMQPQT